MLPDMHYTKFRSVGAQARPSSAYSVTGGSAASPVPHGST